MWAVYGATDSRITGYNLIALFLFAANLLTCACGGAPTTTTTTVRIPPTPAIPTTGGYAILNGDTLSAASSHWLSQDCSIQLELASNSWMIYSITGLGAPQGSTFLALTEWSIGTTDKDVAIPLPPAARPEVFLSGITGIEGTTSSGNFHADLIIIDGDNRTHVYACPFALQSGPLPGFTTSQ